MSIILPSLGLLKPKGSTLLTSLISYWKLDEASGNASDSIGSNTLTANASPVSATGKIGNARQFVSATAQYLNKTSNAGLQTGDIDFSISCWVYLDSSKDMSFVAKWISGNREYLLGFRPSRMYFYVSSNGSAVSSVISDTFGAPSLSTWYHVVAWHDSVNNLIGISVNNVSDTASYSSGITAQTTDFVIGRNLDDTSWDMNGRIDEVGFWKKVLTSTERTALYNAGAGLTYPF